MVAPTSHADGVLFEDAAIGRGLARIQQHGSRAFQKVRDLAGVTRNAAHTLQVVKRHTLPGKQHADVAPQHCELLTCTNTVAIGA